ncbi:MAG: GNAT family N-acetyltransferase [Pirellulales bacterium]|nr:GNAT family N-acetyltransferase [Pirellulales bacterium]
MIQIQEINDWNDLDALRLPWSLLLADTRGASFFHTWDWLRTYAQHYGQANEPRILVARHERDIIGILPLVLKSERNRLGTFKTLTYPLDDWGNFYSPIGRDQTVILHAGMQHIASMRRDFDVINLHWVPSRRFDRGRTPRAMQAAGFQANERKDAPSAVVELQATWEDYWASRSSKWRNNVRRNERKLAEAGEVAYVHYRPRGAASGDADPRWDLYDACEHIAQASWQGNSQTGTTISHTEVRAFLRDMHSTAVDAGGLDLHLLYLNGCPAAFAYNYHYRGMVTGLRTGFDANVSRDGTGTTLICRSIRTAYQHGDHTLDLGADFLHCKRNWITSRIFAYSYSHYPLFAPRSQLARLKRLWEARRQRKHNTPTAHRVLDNTIDARARELV